VTKPASRKTVRDTPLQPLGMFAVFRHSTKLSRAHFSALHNDYATASAEAIRLVAMSAAEDPARQHHYYVVQVAARFSAGVEGLKSLER
jgi:LAS superfamily LD-carboxypeptidase LdcB